MGLLESLLDIEEASGPWDFQVDGVHPWALVRTSVLEERVKRERGFSAARATSRPGPSLPRQMVQHLRALQSIAIPGNQKRDALFFTPATVRVRDDQSPGSRNRLYDVYYRSFERPAIYEKGCLDREFEPLVRKGNMILDDTLQYLMRLWARLRGLETDQERQVTTFVDSIVDNFDLEDARDWIIDITRMHLRWALNREALTRLIDLDRSSRVAFVHSASYMKWYGIITRLLHDHGFQVVEVQHGYISSEHVAYNYPRACLDDPNHPCRGYLPDHLLLFGKFWSRGIRTPARTHVMGYPHLNRLADRVRNKIISEPTSILIISQGYVTERMVEVALALNRGFPERTIHFKLHPGEVPFTERYGSLLGVRNIIVEADRDIHELIAMCGVIVGYFSTALFEALKFGDKRLFLLDNDLVPDTLGHKFTTPGELVKAILDERLGRPDIPSDLVWYPHWNKAFNKFKVRVLQ